MSELQNDLLKLQTKLNNIESNMDLSKLSDEDNKQKLNKRIEEKLNVLFETKNQSIKLNVGGQPFEIARHSITNCRFETILNMFLEKGNEERIFLDINPNYFHFIMSIVIDRSKSSTGVNKFTFAFPDYVDEFTFKESLVRFFNSRREILTEINFISSKSTTNNQTEQNNDQPQPLPIVNNYNNNYNNEY